MTLADVAALAATVLSGISLLPQIRKLVRTGDVRGISPTWPVFGMVTNAAWLAYLAAEGLWAALASPLLMVGLYGVIVGALVRLDVPLARGAARGTVWGAALLAVYVVARWSGLGLVLGWSYALQVAPQVTAAYRSDHPAGIAPATWVIAVGETGLWGYYGLARGDVPVATFGAIGVTAALLILGRYVAVVARTPAPG